MSDTRVEVNTPDSGIDRRQFLGSAAATGLGLGLAMPRPLWAAADGEQSKVRLGIVGIGRQGKILLNNALTGLANVQFVAVCDIWQYNRDRAYQLCQRAGHKARPYEDHQQMLEKEKGNLDGVFVATPDIHHAQVTNDCLKEGVHVYCEKEMATNLEEAASMVRTARQEEALLQIGHQRRSNPYYKHARQLMHKENFCGRITAVRGQWNQLKRVRAVPNALLTRLAMSKSKLGRYGFNDMAEYHYWRWFKDISGGPMADLGSHQVDVFNWFLGAAPHRIAALGGNDWAKHSAKENDAGYTPTQLDHTFAMYQYETEAGPVHAFYQVLLSASKGGFYEQFMGDGGTIQTAEMLKKSGMFKEAGAEPLKWEQETETVKTSGGERKMTFKLDRTPKEKMKKEQVEVRENEDQKLLKKALHLPHQENFVDAIRGNEELTCPPEIGYETAVTSLKAHEAAVTGKPIDLSEADFKVQA